MKMLNIDVHDVKDLTKMTQDEAYQFLKDGIHVICRVSPRDFQEVYNVQELDGLVHLREMRIYDSLEYYMLQRGDKIWNRGLRG